MKERLSKLVLALKNHPNLVLGNVEGFSSYRFFLEGYFFGLDANSKISISNELNRFVNKVENGIDSGNIIWTKVFDFKYHEVSEKEKLKKLFDLLELFLSSTDGALGSVTDVLVD
jgi:hypothetical protein